MEKPKFILRMYRLSNQIKLILTLCLITLLNPTAYPGHYLGSEKIQFLNEINLDSHRFHEDSVHTFNFRYPDKKRGFGPYILPASLIVTGTILHNSPELKMDFQEMVRSNFRYSGSADDYLQYAPLIAVYALNMAGVEGKNNFGNRTAIAAKAILLNSMVVSGLKTWTNTRRPGGGLRSFPSGHTSFSFAVAHFMHKEFGDQSKWFSVGAYSCAATVGFMRIAKDAHWISDVVAGAGFGILATELVYLTHQYKWDNEHLKRLDIFPFRVNRQNGLTLVYTF